MASCASHGTSYERRGRLGRRLAGQRGVEEGRERGRADEHGDEDERPHDVDEQRLQPEGAEDAREQHEEGHLQRVAGVTDRHEPVDLDVHLCMCASKA